MVLRAIYTSRSSMNAEQQKLDSISNNLANVNTDGYKREDVSFQDLVYESLKRKGYPTNEKQNTILNGTGVKAGKWIRDNEQGNLKSTDSTTDFAIDGEGFFRVTMTDGKKGYERSGSLNIDSNGDLVDKNGNRLDIELTEEGQNLKNSGVTFTKDNFSVKESGEIYLKDNNNSVYYGKINLYKPISQDSFSSIGQNIYVSSDDNTQIKATSDANILQGFLESSNVDPGKELTDMIVAQRAFEMGSRAMKTGDEMWGMINSMKGR